MHCLRGTGKSSIASALVQKYLYAVIAYTCHSKQSAEIDGNMRVLKRLQRRRHVSELLLHFHASGTARFTKAVRKIVLRS